MFKNVNLREELTRARGPIHEVEADAVLNEAFSLLYKSYCDDERIEKALKEGGKPTSGVTISWSALSPERIFSIKEIRETSVKHRLRFLDSKHFKGEIPYEAKAEIKRLEKELGMELTEFKLMAPGERFVLTDCDKDPLLFLKLSENYYYLIHQWGNDMVWYRKWMFWPLRSLTTLGITIATVSMLLALLVPTELIVGDATHTAMFARLALFFWCLVSITSVVAYIGFAFFKNVSAFQWNSPHFKQEF